MFRNDFMEVRVLGNYDKLYALCKKLKRNIEKQKVTEGTKRKQSYLCCHSKQVDSRVYYQHKISLIKRDI